MLFEIAIGNVEIANIPVLAPFCFLLQPPAPVDYKKSSLPTLFLSGCEINFGVDFGSEYIGKCFCVFQI
jgi:hypothetical protein